MDKRKSDAASAIQRKKKAKANEVHGRIPITAFFERIPPRPRPEGTPPAAHDHIEEIDEDVISTERTTNTAPSTSHMVQETLKFEQNEKTVPKRTFTGFHMLRGRELRGGLPLRHRQHVLRSVVKSYAPLGVAPLPDIQPSQWISCMQFDTDGVLLATGSSDGTIALYDFDEYFHRMLVFCNQRTNMEAPTTTDNISISLSSTCPNAGAPSCIKPIHVLHTRRELKRVRWNPMDQDMLACSFTSRNEIFLFNLKKFPAEPYRILKAPTRPSTGYYDFLFTTSKSTNAPCLIGGDVDGSVRMWDLHVPSKPLWTVAHNPREVGCINSMCLCARRQHLVCATDQAWIVVYDTWQLVVPAFGQRPGPKRVAMFDLLVHLQGTPATRHVSVSLGGGIVSVQLVPHTIATVVCQLLNDWVVVVDVLRPQVLQLHTVLRGDPRLNTNVPRFHADPTMYSNGEEGPWTSSHVLSARTEASYLKLHRCMGSFVFDGAVFATGFASDNGLYAIDMQSPPSAHPAAKDKDKTEPPTFHMLRRLRIPMDQMVTAVAAHPVSHVIVCGMQTNALAVLGPVASDESTTMT